MRRAALPLSILCPVLLELLDGWTLLNISQLCPAAYECASGTLDALRSGWCEILSVVKYLQASPGIQYPGFEPADGLQLRLCSLHDWDPPHHRCLRAQAVRFMRNSFNYFVGQSNDFGEWIAEREDYAGLSPIEILQRMNAHLRECVGFKKLLDVLTHGKADFLYSSLETDFEVEAMVGPIHCMGPGLLIVFRYQCLPVVLCVRYTETTYRAKIFLPFLASLTD